VVREELFGESVGHMRRGDRVTEEMIAIDQATTVAPVQEQPVTLFEQVFSLEIGNNARIYPGHQELRSWLSQTPASARVRRVQDSTRFPPDG
jgi:hypothetical protein